MKPSPWWILVAALLAGCETAQSEAPAKAKAPRAEGCTTGVCPLPSSPVREAAMKTTKTREGIPALDAQIPAQIETATFGLG
jgi:hypothetical protein